MYARPRFKLFARFMMAVVGFCLVFAGAFTLRGSSQPAGSAELPPLETRILGQSHWLCRGPVALRIITTDHRTGDPVRADVILTLKRTENGKPAGNTIPLYTGESNNLGTVDARLTAPDEPGAYTLTVRVESPIGNDEITQPIQLDESAQVMLTADKPLYQPGQTMHLRALALSPATRDVIAGKPLLFEIEDARGNKVFKQRVTLSKFGIAAAEFTLADEVNMGTYTLRATLPAGQTEKKVQVARYVLPKFKLAITTDKPYYLPGETVKGTVQADYFFGKPVANADVTIDVSTIDIGVDKLATLSAKTDAAGTYHFEYALPDSFVGQPFEQGKAMVGFHASVVDTAEHREGADATVPVTQDPALLVIVPENRVLIHGVPNRVYLAAATPDGAPLKGARLTVFTSIGPNHDALTTDEYGLATYEFTPRDEPVTITADVETADGRHTSVSTTLDRADSNDGIILRVDKPLAKVGDRIGLTAISTIRGGTVYLDVLRDKQTILTQALPVHDGIARLNLPLTAEMTGTLELHAYRILPNEDIIRDSRVVVVSPADDLHIDVKTDKTEYRPGDEAQLTFSVQDQQQHPIAAALGLTIVDESVFALSELQPGLEKIYFTLEKELMEPQYEIHGLKPADLIMHESSARDGDADAGRQRAAAMLFAGVPQQDDFDFHINTYQQRWEKVKSAVTAEMVQASRKIVRAIAQYQQKTGSVLTADQSLFTLVEQGYLQESDLKDRWGNYYKTDLHGATNYGGWFTLNSAGPDGRWGTVDDMLGISMYSNDRDMVFKAGRGGDMIIEEAAMPANAPMPMMRAANAVGAMDSLQGVGGAAHSQVSYANGEGTVQAAATVPVHVREYFPETMYWNPAIITDEHGRAEVRVPMADSITTWRMSLTANSRRGQLGSTTAPLRVFQDFFVDIDLPISLTQHDRVSIPVAVYNYLPTAQQVTLTLDKAAWFTLEGNNVQTVEMGPNEVKVVHFPITVNEIGHFPLTVHAQGSKLSDAIRRAIDILPDGKEVRTAINDRLEGQITKTVNIPDTAIPGASDIWVKLYPGTFSQVVEGLDGLLRMPNGCFEQTSSTTYPNVLVLDYLKQSKKVNPELQMKAEQYINVGYQRLVTFECKSGGFSWFGNEPAHQILTAYGLLEFSDMAKVHDVDPALISRTQRWLADRQQQDGTWKADQGGIAEGIINRQTGELRSTAYIAWALAESGFRGEQLNRAVSYVKAHLSEAKDPYTLAVMLNLLTVVERDSEMTARVAQRLIETAKVTDKTAYWVSDTETFTGAKEKGADLETTGLATYALVRWGRNSGITNKALTYLVQSRDSFGSWESTQGTVWSLKALLLASSHGVGGNAGTVTVLANGHEVTTITITEDNSDVMRQIDLAGNIHTGCNTITLRYNGKGSLLYQIVGRYYLPWEQAMNIPAQRAPMSIAVAYDKTTLTQDDTATVTATITNNTRMTVEMPLIDLGIPPGFTVNTEKLDAAVQQKTISKYTQAARQIIVYLEKLDPGQTVTLTYQLKARYPIKARTPRSAAYPYYNPEQTAISTPQNIIVK